MKQLPPLTEPQSDSQFENKSLHFSRGMSRRGWVYCGVGQRPFLRGQFSHLWRYRISDGGLVLSLHPCEKDPEVVHKLKGVIQVHLTAEINKHDKQISKRFPITLEIMFGGIREAAAMLNISEKQTMFGWMPKTLLLKRMEFKVWVHV